MGSHDPFKDDALFHENLFARGKSAYVTGKKADVPCILCAIRDGAKEIESRKLYQDAILFVILNAYPFNPGHLMIMPCRHVERWRDLTQDETVKIAEFIKKSQDVLEREFGCTSFNFGVNEGPFSGASIAHLHVQVIPRFKSELGFIDVVGKTRAMIYTLDQVHEKLKEKLA
nr:HIT domain-containing protein [Candidatus Sigynarchaeota archaeon]